jgi:DNA-binding GntR family transcriptional regulator
MVRQSGSAQTVPKRPIDTTDLQYTKLRQHLIDGRFPPGSLLLETTLSVQYGVSRTPMREALGRLAQDGMIERSARGFRVRARTPEEIIDIYDARIALESTCAGLAAVRHTDFDVARLAHLVEERRRATDPRTFAKLNNSWHDALRSAGHNPTITELLGRLDTLLEIYRSKNSQPAADRSVDDHAEILTAIRDRDADAAELQMRDHLRHMRDRRVANLLDGV